MVDPDWSDADVISASLLNPDLFREIFRRHHDAVFGFLARRVGRDLAADLASEVFLRAFKLRGRYDASRRSCRPWLYGFAVNLVGDRLRRARLEYRQHLIWDPPDDPVSASDHRLAAWELRHQLDGALASLRRIDREVILLHSLEQLTYQEIGETLRIPIGTVKSRLARARRQMRDLIEGFDQIGP